MSDRTIGFLGFLLGWWLGLALPYYLGIGEEAQELREQCELNLPRNQECHLVYLKPGD